MERRTDSCEHSRSNAYYGLRISCGAVPVIERKIIHDFIRLILPRHSKVPYAADMWKFVLLDDGTVSEIHRNPDVRHRDDLPNHYLFTEAYDQIREGLAALSITPAPPVRRICNVSAWHAVDKLRREIRNSRKTWRGWIKDKFAVMGFCDGFPHVEYPSSVPDVEQMSQLCEWIAARVIDGTLLKAILRSTGADVRSH